MKIIKDKNGKIKKYVFEFLEPFQRKSFIYLNIKEKKKKKELNEKSNIVNSENLI